MDGTIHSQKKILILLWVIIICALLLFIKLFYIQIISGKSYLDKASQQRMLPITVESIRGDILDRNGIPFTNEKNIYYLVVFPGAFHANDEEFNLIYQMTGVNKNRLENMLHEKQSYCALEILRPMPDKEADILSGKYPGLSIIEQSRRYNNNSIARHVIGYIKKDGTAMMGIEKSLDLYLNGHGTNVIYGIADAKKNIIPGLGINSVTTHANYSNIRLTLDYHIQKILEDTLDKYNNKSGGIIVDIKTGEIIALASRPNYDQCQIYNHDKEEDCFWSIPLKSFPPGSVFKIIPAAVALEEGRYNGDDTFVCNGNITINNTSYSCHPATNGLGIITIGEAFAYSCNDTFIKIADQVGGDKIIQMAKKFGFGSSINIGLPSDKGMLPEKDKYAGAGIGNLAIGQGNVMTTPLQIVDMIVTIASGGQRKQLKLIKSIIDDNKIEKPWKYDEINEQVISNETAKELQKWMGYVTQYGTGIKAMEESIGGTAGKTGTPQVSGDDEAKYYGWFAGFFPQTNPKYAAVIMSRQEGEGGKTAAPIFRDIAIDIWKYENKIK